MKQKTKRQNLKSKIKTRTLNFDEVRPKIIMALNNDKYVARTVNGIANEISLSEPFVVRALKNDKILRSQMKVYPRKSRDGNVLVTTKKHFDQKASFRDKFIDAFSTKRVTLDDIK